MKPMFSVLEGNYPQKKKVTREELFNEIGWSDLIDNFNYANTCAIRVSLALIKSHFYLPGRMKINLGPFKGRKIEPGHGKLSHLLASKSMLGKPEKFAMDVAERGIASRSGIVSFWNLHPSMGDTQGHIDIVSTVAGGIKTCGTDCYWHSKEVWFWPLK
jgi:hypothetical protein